MTKERLVVIGNGMAGARVVEELLRRGGSDRFDIAVFGEEPYGNYNRILLSDVLNGSHEARDIFLNPLDWYKEHGIRLHAGIQAECIDRARREVHGAGVCEPYDQLILATGSRPLVPPLEGLQDGHGCWKDGIFVFRTLDDCAHIRSYAGKSRRAVVIGGGLLGLEAARGLLTYDLEVHVVQREGTLMNLQLDSPAGRMLQQTIQQLGITVHLEATTAGILGDSAVTGLAFADGSTLACDMVIMACGILPNVGLARMAGLDVERGVVVDDGLSTSDPRVHAIGECAQHRGQVYGLVTPLWDQARVLADRLAATNPGAAYQGSRLFTRLKVLGVELAAMGDKEPTHPDDEVVLYSEPSRGVYKKLIVRDNQLRGAILLGDSAMAASLVQLFDRGAPLPDSRAELLFAPGDGLAAGLRPETLPDDTQICNCNGVSKGAIVASVQAGRRNLKAVCDATRAGTGCGSCRSQVGQIVEWLCDGQTDEDPAVHYYVPGVPLAKPELIAAIRQLSLRSVSAVFKQLAAGVEDAASKVGLASLLKTIWGPDYVDERDARFINDRVHANIQRDGTFSVVPRVYGGVTSPAQLRRIADVAERFKVPMVKITGGQRLDLLGISKEDLPQVWQELGMPSGHAYTKAFRTCKTCVGTDFCRYGLGDSVGMGIAIEMRFQGVESPHKMKLATAGCPRNCSEATTKDLGAVAVEGHKWEVYVGGAAGSRVRKGDVLCTVNSRDKVLLYMGRFIQYYREHGKYLERTYDFVERLGIERLRQVLVEDTDGVCERLDAEIQAAVDAYRDPWREADAPVHISQFTSTVAAVESSEARHLEPVLPVLA